MMAMEKALFSRFGRKHTATCWRQKGEWRRGITRVESRIGNLVRFELKGSSSKARNITGNLMLRWSTPVVVTKVVGPNTVLLAYPDSGVV